MTKNGSMKMSGGGNKSQGLPATTNKKTGSLIRHIMKEAYSNPKQRSGGSKEQQKQKTPSFSYEVSSLSVSLKSSQFPVYTAKPPTLGLLPANGFPAANSITSFFLSPSATLPGLLRLVFEFNIDKDLTKSNGGKIKIDVSKTDGSPLPFFGNPLDIPEAGNTPSWWPSYLTSRGGANVNYSWNFYLKDGTGADISNDIEISVENVSQKNGYNVASTLVLQLKSSSNGKIGNGNCTFILAFNGNSDRGGAPTAGRWLGQGPYQFFVGGASNPESGEAAPGVYVFSITSANNNPSTSFTLA